MIYLYQLKKALKDLTYVILHPFKSDLYDVSDFLLSFNDLWRLIKNPYALMEDEKWFTIEISPRHTGYNHKLIIINGTLRKNPIIMICDPKLVVCQIDIFDEFTAVPLETDYKLNYKYFKYKISQEDLIHYKKFVEYNYDVLREIYYDKERDYTFDKTIAKLTFI